MPGNKPKTAKGARGTRTAGGRPRRARGRPSQGLRAGLFEWASRVEKKAAPVRKSQRRGQGQPAANRRRRPAEEGARAGAVPLAPAASGRLTPLARRAGAFVARFMVAGGLAWGLLLGAQQAYAYATTSPRFAAQHLLYTPTSHLAPERVAELLGIAEGTNILALEPTELEGRIARDRWVAQVRVRRELPDTLRVEVVEHEPAAVLLADRFYLINREGHPFKVLERGERGSLPVITGIDRDALEGRSEAGEGAPGPVDAAVRAKIRRALGVAALYAEDGERPPLGEVHVGAFGELTIYTTSGAALRLGRDDFAGRLARFDALRAALGEHAESLAVVHLDAIATEDHDHRERIVASLRDPEAEAAILGRGSAAPSGDRDDHAKEPKRVAARSRAASDAAASVSPPQPPTSERPRRRVGAAVSRRIPRYE